MKTAPLFAASVVLSLFAGAVPAQDRAAPPASAMTDARDWSATLVEDATALHDIIIDSHPGVSDPLNPGFRKRTDDGLAQALTRAKTTTDAGGYWWAMRAYVAAFDDGHVQISLRVPGYGFQTRWPGFLTAYRGDAQIVASRDEADADAPPLGARLIDCDGVSADALAQQRIGAFRGRWFLESQHAQFGDYLFMSPGNPWITEMKTCRFEAAGETRAYELNWRAADSADLGARRGKLAQRVSPPFGLTRRDDGAFWLSMPSFDGTQGSDAHTALTALLAEAANRQAELRAAPSVVLDVRGNGGGSSHWSYELARTLWGEPWMEAHPLPRTQAVEWRASDANIAEMTQFLASQKAGDANPQLIAWGEKAVQGMTAARAAGQVYWRDANAPTEAQPASPLPADPVAGRVYVLTDASCGSACLDAVDVWKVNGAVQVGRETSADTVYMEVRDAILPSNLAQIGVPMKVYRGRARGNNEPQRPAHVFDGDMSDDAAIAAWIRTLPRAD